MAKKLQVTLKRSLIGRPETHKIVVQTLGLRKVSQTVVHNDSPAIRGMINKVNYLLEVQEINE